MKFEELHSWDCDLKTAQNLQRELAKKLILDRPIQPCQRIVAVDVSHNWGSSLLHAGAVVFDLALNEVIEEVSASQVVSFPYISGFLSFRELPPLLNALSKIESPYEAILCDGQGIAHPRGLGIASHLGIWLNCPTLGCAKSLLFGSCQEPKPEKGSQAPLLAPDQRVIGTALRTRAKVKPVYISPGHLCDLKSAVDLVLKLLDKTRLPKPSQLAHQFVNRVRREYNREH